MIAAVLLPVVAAAQSDFATFLSPRFGEQRVSVDYDVRAGFNEDVDGQDSRLHLVRHDFSLSVPLHQSDQDEWTLFAGVEALDIDSRARIPRTGAFLPGELWDVQVGTAYRRKLENDWIVGGSFALGSASDRPFASWQEWVVSFNGFLRIPHGERNAWVFLLNYSNNREFLRNIPIPGVAYYLSPDDSLRSLIGVPYSSVTWQPIERLELEASYFIPRTIHAKVGYRLLDPLQAYISYDWDNQEFFRADRRDSDDRLFYYEQRVMAGVKWDITPQVWLDCGAGYAFDRYFFEGEDWDDRGKRRIEFDDGPMISLRLGMRL